MLRCPPQGRGKLRASRPRGNAKNTDSELLSLGAALPSRGAGGAAGASVRREATRDDPREALNPSVCPSSVFSAYARHTPGLDPRIHSGISSGISSGVTVARGVLARPRGRRYSPFGTRSRSTSPRA